MTNRGIPLNEIDHYFHTTDNDILPPASIKNMSEGAAMLLRHIKNGDKVMIQIDGDCDGITSSALLLNYLYRLFPNTILNNFTYRFHNGKEHGLIYETIPEDIKLVIAPDSASNDIEVHKQLAERGTDVLVIDHHLADEYSPYACIINNQMCDYPTKSLSGAGMVYKFCSFIDELLGEKVADNFVDLACVGCVGDMVEVKDFETKRIITKGIEKVQNPFISAMCDAQAFSISRHGGYDIFSIAFYIVPYINATIRSGDMSDKLLLFNSMLEYKAYQMVPSTKRGCKGQQEQLVEQAVRNCKNVKNHQTKENDILTARITKIIEERQLLNNKILIVTLPQGLINNKNLTGLVANQLAHTYARPVLLLNELIEADGTHLWSGSGRNCENSKLPNLNQFLTDLNLALEVAGHENAFGITIEDSRLPEFIAAINDKLKNVVFTSAYLVDAIYENQDCDAAEMLKLAGLKSVWGQGLPEPYIAIQNLLVTKNRAQILSRDKSPTIKIGTQSGLELIKFGATEEDVALIDNIGEGSLWIDVVGRCDVNAWNGRFTPQLKIVDYEIKNYQSFCF